MYKILVVDDDVIICGGIKVYLEKQGYSADCAYSAAETRTALSNQYDLVILDINLPDGNGLDLCSEIRINKNIPVIFLTANDTDDNIIDGFKHGGDDYISKPFSVEVLNQRIKAVLRRSNLSIKKQFFSYMDLSVDFGKMQVSLNGIPVKLSATEYKLLELLIRNKGQVLTRGVILERIWDSDGNYIDENTLNVHIRRLRQKIETDPKKPQYIITVFGIGYMFGE
jgi:DNA-binding response OmpR family regulator